MTNQTENILISPRTRELVRIALAEDAPFGDLSAECSVPAEHRSSARVIARETLTFCGERFLPMLFEEFAGNLEFSIVARDGSVIKDGEELVILKGSTRHILQIERPLLNFLQRLTGVASRTAEIVAQAGSVAILDTRKTMPGWRELDKYATRVGGARNHRFSLSDMILIKNNHIDAHGGSVSETLQSVFSKKPAYIPVQVEVRTRLELEQVIPFAPNAVLLDNMSDELISECLALLKQMAPDMMVEISGGITLERLPKLAALGVPAVSMGTLTTAARNRDISLRITSAPGVSR